MENTFSLSFTLLCVLCAVALVVVIARTVIKMWMEYKAATSSPHTNSDLDLMHAQALMGAVVHALVKEGYMSVEDGDNWQRTHMVLKTNADVFPFLYKTTFYLRDTDPDVFFYDVVKLVDQYNYDTIPEGIDSEEAIKRAIDIAVQHERFEMAATLRSRLEAFRRRHSRPQ